MGVLIFVAALPNVAFPTIVVTVQLPGASPNTMAARKGPSCWCRATPIRGSKCVTT
jgi:hypothetical protein